MDSVAGCFINIINIIVFMCSYKNGMYIVLFECVKIHFSIKRNEIKGKEL